MPLSGLKGGESSAVSLLLRGHFITVHLRYVATSVVVKPWPDCAFRLGSGRGGGLLPRGRALPTATPSPPASPPLSPAPPCPAPPASSPASNARIWIPPSRPTNRGLGSGAHVDDPTVYALQGPEEGPSGSGWSASPRSAPRCPWSSWRCVRYIDNFSSGQRGAASTEYVPRQLLPPFASLLCCNLQIFVQCRYFLKAGYAVIFIHRRWVFLAQDSFSAAKVVQDSGFQVVVFIRSLRFAM